MVRFVALSILLAVCVPAKAAINSVQFSGTGVVTYSSTFSDFFPPPVGALVSGGGEITFAEALPDNFTGVVIMRQSDIEQGRYTFSFGIGGASGNSDANGSRGGTAYFYLGGLTRIFLFADRDPNYLDLRGSAQGGGWNADLRYGELAAWGGTFTLDAAPELGAVPEPASWALMVTGFGLVGSSLRRRRTTFNA